jgi:hypothetical protein
LGSIFSQAHPVTLISYLELKLEQTDVAPKFGHQ